MKKVFTILIVLLFLYIPNVYGEDLKFYEVKIYEVNSEEDISQFDGALVSYFIDHVMEVEHIQEDNMEAYNYYDKNHNLLFVVSIELTDNDIIETFEVAKNVPYSNMDYVFSEEERQMFNSSEFDYDGVRLIFRDDSYSEPCDSVCIYNLSQESISNTTLIKENPNYDGLELNFDVSFRNVNDYVTYKVEIDNPTDTDFKVLTGEDFGDSEYIKYEYSFGNENDILEANSNKTMYVTVRYNKAVSFTGDEPFQEENKAVIKLSNDPEDLKTDDNKEEPPIDNKEETPIDDKKEEEVKVPDTYTGLSVLIVFGLIAILGYISYNKLSAKPLLLLLIPILLIPVIVKAYEKLELKVNTNIEIRSYINLMEARYENSNNIERDFWLKGNEIKTITFFNKIEEPSRFYRKYDVSRKKDKSVVAYLINEVDSYYMDLYIMADGEIYLSPESRSLFANMTNLTNIYNLNYVNTSKVTNMSNMFYGCNRLTELDLSGFDTSNVTDMNSMFSGTGRFASSFSLNLGDNFNISNVTDMQDMFCGIHNSYQIPSMFPYDTVTCLPDT